MATVLGLDVGSNSVGWALINTDTEEVVDLGVRIFQEGVENLNGQNEQSRGVQRRMKRALRKQYERRRERKNNLRRILIDAGLLPSDSAQFATLIKLDPYQLRTKGLDAELSMYELGRALDHLNARRGFKSNRKSVGDEEESGTIYSGSKDHDKPGIDEITNSLDPRLRTLKSYRTLSADISSGREPEWSGFRTIGEYLNSLNPKERRRRNRYTLREHYEVEFEMLIAKQRQFHASMLSDEVVDQIRNAIFWQRPLKSSRDLVGPCRFEPGKKRCRRSHPEFQQFRMLQQLNALRIYGGGRIEEEEQMLKDSERQILMRYLTTEGTLTLEKPAKIKKLLKLDSKVEYVFNSEKIDAPMTLLKIRKALGEKKIEGFGREEWHQLWNTLNYAEDRDWVEHWAIERLGCKPEQAKALSMINLEQGHGSLSLRAIRKIMPFLEQGLIYSEACAQAGYAHHDPDGEIVITDRVPALNRRDVRNPIVQTSFAELRKVVNAVIKRYGAPTTIRVELGREIKQPLAIRLKAQKINKDNERVNQDIRARLRDELGIEHPSRADIQRFKLWEAQNHQCMYTGQQISIHDLYNGSVDVDHIIPYSQSLDDGMINKVVCSRAINAAKGDRIPLEAISAGVVDGEQLKERVASLVRANKIPRQKAARFFMTREEVQQMLGGDFIERQLNDTRYIGRLATKYLRHVCSDVSVTNGLLTSVLRHRWGLNGILPELAERGRAWVDPEAVANSAKSRADHRHHAIDAVVIALTSRSLLQRLSTLNASGLGTDIDEHARRGRLRLPEEPIPGLRSMVMARVDRTIVSHRVRRKVRGPLHEETVYGLAKDPLGQQQYNDRDAPLYVVRKPVESLTTKELLHVADPVVKQALLTRLKDLGVDTTHEKFAIPKNAFLEPIYLRKKDGSRGPRIKRVRVLKASSGMVKLREYGAFVEPGSNDHMRLGPFDENGKRAHWEVKSLFEIGSDKAQKTEDLMFRINELYTKETDEFPCDAFSVYRVQKIRKTDGQVVFRHNAASTLDDSASESSALPNKIRGKKLSVDVLGHILSERI